MLPAVSLSLASRLVLQRLFLGDQPRAVLATQVNPKPAPRHGQPRTRSDQEIDMGKSPYPPCQHALELEPAKIDHRRAFADRGKIALMAVAEG